MPANILEVGNSQLDTDKASITHNEKAFIFSYDYVWHYNNQESNNTILIQNRLTFGERKKNKQKNP